MVWSSETETETETKNIESIAHSQSFKFDLFPTIPCKMDLKNNCVYRRIYIDVHLRDAALSHSNIGANLVLLFGAVTSHTARLTFS